MKFSIAKPVVDLRKEPKWLFPLDFSHNDLRLSQLLYSEQVELIEEKGPWLFVKALWQSVFRKDLGFGPYEGWIHVSEVIESPSHLPTHVLVAKKLSLNSLTLSYGTYLTVQENKIHLLENQKVEIQSPELLRALSAPFCFKRLCREAHLFLDDPYLFGGAAAFINATVSGVDCSGLVHLLFRAQNRLIPRDAHDQWLKSTPLQKEQIDPGDVLFLAPENKPERITHMLLYVGDGYLIESPCSGEKVRKIAIKTHVKEEGEMMKLIGREKRYHPHWRRFAKELLFSL